MDQDSWNDGFIIGAIAGITASGDSVGNELVQFIPVQLQYNFIIVPLAALTEVAL